MLEHEDKIIVEWLKRGDEKAYKHLYDFHYVFLCKVANEFLKDPFLSETIVGDIIFHLWEIRETLDISISLRSYLIRAVRNRCINFLQLEREQREVNFSALAPGDAYEERFLTDHHPLGSLLERELENEITASIERLPEECRNVFKKSRFENKKYEEIANELGVSVNTVKYHIKNALSRLHDDLGKYLMTLLLLFIK